MRWKFLLLIFILVGTQPAEGQATGSETAPNQVVSYCDLMRHPDRYDSHTVQVTATYAAGLEGAVFFDDECKASESLPEVTSVATFVADGPVPARDVEQLRKFLVRHKTDQARLTVIAVFTDNYIPKQKPVRLTSPRYTLEVKRVLAVHKVEVAKSP